MKPDDLNKNWYDVSSPDAARTLIDATKRHFIEPFIGRECSLSQAAEELGIKLTAMLYQVERLTSLGLLRQVGVRSRRGRPIKLYSASAERFFVPFHATTETSMTSFLSVFERDAQSFFLHNLAEAALQGSAEWGVRVYRQDAGVVRVETVPSSLRERALDDIFFNPQFIALWAGWQHLELNFGTAKALQHDLKAVWERYEAMQTPGEQAYLVRWGLTPIVVDNTPK